MSTNVPSIHILLKGNNITLHMMTYGYFYYLWHENSDACFPNFRAARTPFLLYDVYTNDSKHGLVSRHCFSSVLVDEWPTFFGNSCPIGWLFVLIVFCLFVILVIPHFGFESGICLLIAPVPVHCFLITFKCCVTAAVLVVKCQLIYWLSGSISMRFLGHLNRLKNRITHFWGWRYVV